MLKRICNFVNTRKIIRKANKEGSSICRQTGIDKNTFSKEEMLHIRVAPARGVLWGTPPI